MEPSTCSTPNFQIRIYGTLPSMVRNTPHSQIIRIKWSFNNQFLIACEILHTKPCSLSYFRRCFTIWSVEIVALGTLPKMNGILSTYRIKYNLHMSQVPVSPDYQKRTMYDCVIVRSYRGVDEILDAEGKLDNESDASDIDINEFRTRRDSSLHSITSSTRGEPALR